ncbi:hypothetical protein HYU93_01285 [Candidatus Daviesbacteria bacterium]|nr:hypothetical protein [Candidatus Daviesbacteria bacterium]
MIEAAPVIKNTPPWWFRYPTLIVNKTVHVLPKQGRSRIEAEAVFTAAQPIFQTITTEFEKAGCNTITINEGCPVTRNGSNPTIHSIIINPVYLGALPRQVEASLLDYPTNPDDDRLMRALKKYIPEEKRPLLASMGKAILRKLGLHLRSREEKKESEQSFVNIVFVRDDNDALTNAPSRAKQLVNWALLSKIGAFKEALVPYKVVNGQIEFSPNSILATLEGGHPFMDNIALAQQLMVLGSVRNVGSPDLLENANPISRLQWRRSAVINGLRELGRFLGEKDALSPPLAFHHFVKGRRLIQRLKIIAEWSRQAEGAFMAFDPEMQTDAIDLPWTGVPIVTSSGKFGAVKTRLGVKDVITAIPLRKTKPTDKSKIVYLSVKGHKPRKPSVEGDEFTHPQLELSLEEPNKYSVKMQKVEGGYVKSSEGNRIVPAARGVVCIFMIKLLLKKV